MMRSLEAEEILAEGYCFTEQQLNTTIDYASHQKNIGDADELWSMQMSSEAYRNWLSHENEIYDDIFKDEIQA